MENCETFGKMADIRGIVHCSGKARTWTQWGCFICTETKKKKWFNDKHTILHNKIIEIVLNE